MVARSLRYCGVVVVLACLVAVYGVYIAGGVKIDVFPELAPPRIVIQTDVAHQVGRAEQGEDTKGPEFSELHV